MPRRSLASMFLFAVPALLALVSLSYAEDPSDPAYSSVATDLYTAPDTNSFGIPSGAINVTPAWDKNQDNAVSDKVGALPKDTNNYLGCGGVGQGEFTSGIYNMPETFGKFQQDVNSLLAKQMLAMNFIMPQSSALFDQLNNYGNQRYQVFQAGCNLDALKQDAKKQYLEACVTKVTPGRLKKIKETLTGKLLPKEPLLSSMAYAQAWEVCSNQYISDTTAPKKAYEIRNEMNKAFAQKVRDTENISAALKPLLCPFKADGASDSEEGCWPALLIPQVKLCLDSTMGCSEDDGYTVNEPILTMQRLFDTMRFIVDDLVIARRVAQFTNALDNVDDQTLNQSANEAVLTLSYAGLFRAEDSTATGTVKMGGEASNRPDLSFKDYQLNYMNCKEANILKPLMVLNAKLQLRLPSSATKPELSEIAPADMKPVIKKLALKGVDKADLKAEETDALEGLIFASIGCTANQTIPMLDPKIVASLNTQCLVKDRYAFYAMAGNDVALAATRSIYRYMNNRLKQVYTRLMIEGNVPAADSAAVVSNSPAINARLALVVKESMIPYIENQLARLDEVEAMRGAFGQRVQQIYSKRSGCVYSELPVIGPVPQARPSRK